MSGTEIFRTGEGVPPGWTKIAKLRRSGATVGRVDIYIESPTGQRFRSKAEIRRFLERTRSQHCTADDFDTSTKSVPQEVIDAAMRGDDELPSGRSATPKLQPKQTTSRSAYSAPSKSSRPPPTSSPPGRRTFSDYVAAKPKYKVVVHYGSNGTREEDERREDAVKRKPKPKPERCVRAVEDRKREKPGPLSVKLARRAATAKKSEDETSTESSKEEKKRKKLPFPHSPYNSLLEDIALSHEDEFRKWKFVIAALFLQCHDDKQFNGIRDHVGTFFANFPNPQSIAVEGSWILVQAFLAAAFIDVPVYAYQKGEQLAQNVTQFSYHYHSNSNDTSNEPVEVDELPGTNEYVRFCYKVFIRRDFGRSIDEGNETACFEAVRYREWAGNRQKTEELLEARHDTTING